MKNMTCVEMGGPAACDFAITGMTAEEMAENGGKHVMESHLEIAAQMQNATPDEKAKWMEDFKMKFDAAPEVEAAA